MKTILLIIKLTLFSLFFLLVSLNSNAQEKVIVLKNRNSNTEKIIKEENHIILTYKNGITIRSRFEILNDSSIFINNDTILISDINVITTNRSGLSAAGALVTAGGVGATALGAVILLALGEADALEAIFLLIIGIPVTVVGVGGIVGGLVLLGLGKSKDYDIINWEITIR